VVDTNDWCSGQGKCAVGMGVGKLHIGGKCEAIVLVLILAVSFLSVCAEAVSRFFLR
jgi:hypothetical protein